MKTRIELRTCFALPGSDSETMDLPKGVATVADLINWIGDEMNISLIDPKTGEPENDLEVILNGKDIFFYQDALNTTLNEGDLLEIFLLPLGGG